MGVEMRMQLAEDFAAKLTSGHADTCLWRNSEFRPELASFPPITVEAALDGFSRRVACLAKLAPLPSMELQPSILPTCQWARLRSRCSRNAKCISALWVFLGRTLIPASCQWARFSYPC